MFQMLKYFKGGSFKLSCSFLEYLCTALGGWHTPPHSPGVYTPKLVSVLELLSLPLATPRES